MVIPPNLKINSIQPMKISPIKVQRFGFFIEPDLGFYTAITNFKLDWPLPRAVLISPLPPDIKLSLFSNMLNISVL